MKTSLSRSFAIFHKEGKSSQECIVCVCVWGGGGCLTVCQPFWVILCHLPEKWRREIEETVKELKERDRGERGNCEGHSEGQFSQKLL